MRVASLLGLALLLFGSPAPAAVILRYEFNGNFASPTLEAPGLDGDPILNNAGNSGFSFNNNRIEDNEDGANNEGQAITGGDFFSFAFRATNASFPISLTSMTLDVGLIGGTNGNNRFFVRHSQDAFASTLFTSPNLASLAADPYSVDISALADVGIGGVEFRIYSFSNQDERFHHFDNITINGDVDFEEAPAVPEPASLAVWSVLGLSMAGAAWRRRRAVA